MLHKDETNYLVFIIYTFLYDDEAEAEFQLRISIQFQAGEWWEKKKMSIRGLLVDHNKWIADSKENLKNEILGVKGYTKRRVTVTWLTSFFSQLLTKSLRNKNIKHSSDQTLLSRGFPLPGQFLWLRYKACFLYKSNYKEISSLLMTC